MAYYKTRVSLCSDEEFRQIILESRTFKEALSKLGYHHSGGAYITLRKRIKKLGISTSHMTPRARYGKSQRKIPNEEVFVKGYSGGVKVRDRVLKDNIIPYVCAICGQSHTWNGKELTLTLDHINGDHYDNRIENLRFLCPNCDSQQPTFGAKNKKRYGNTLFRKSHPKHLSNPCPICGGPMTKGAKMCDKCRREKVSKESKRPPREELIKDLLILPTIKIGKKYGVSDKAVRKWLRSYELPEYQKDIMEFREEYNKESW